MSKTLRNERKPLPLSHIIKWYIGWLTPLFAYMLLCALLTLIAFSIAGCGGWEVAGYEIEKI